MSDAQVPSEPLSTLDELRQAIAAYESIVNDYLASQAGGVGYAVGKQHARAEAWKAAFKWLDQISAKTTHAGCIRRNTGNTALLIDATIESNEGMRLIREKLS